MILSFICFRKMYFVHFVTYLTELVNVEICISRRGKWTEGFHLELIDFVIALRLSRNASKTLFLINVSC